MPFRRPEWWAKMAPSHLGANGPISPSEFRRLQNDVARVKIERYGDNPPRIDNHGQERPGFSPTRSNANAHNPNANPAHMQSFLNDDFSWSEVDWSDPGWWFAGYH